MFRSPIITLWLAGVLAAAQLGKVTALAPALRTAFGLSLTGIGWLISLLEVGGALFGFVAGLALGVIGARRMLLAGLAMLAATGLVEAALPRVELLFAARAVEGIGYLLVVISAPTMIIALTRPGPERDKSMALWSTFIPVGVGMGTAITGAAGWFLGVQGAMLGWAVASCVMLALVARGDGPAPVRRGRALPAIGAWLLSLGFGCYTLFLCALTGLLPLFLFDRHATAIATGSVIVGCVTLSALPGSVLSLAWLRRGLTARGRLSFLTCILTGAALLAPFIVRVQGAALCAALAALLLLLAGMARTLIFTRLPALSGGQAPDDPRPDDLRIASAQGLLTQCGAAGALLGPPLGAQVVQAFGWSALGVLVALLVLMLLACLVAAERAGDQRCGQVR